MAAGDQDEVAAISVLRIEGGLRLEIARKAGADGDTDVGVGVGDRARSRCSLVGKALAAAAALPIATWRDVSRREASMCCSCRRSWKRAEWKQRERLARENWRKQRGRLKSDSVLQNPRRRRRRSKNLLLSIDLRLPFSLSPVTGAALVGLSPREAGDE